MGSRLLGAGPPQPRTWPASWPTRPVLPGGRGLKTRAMAKSTRADKHPPGTPSGVGEKSRGPAAVPWKSRGLGSSSCQFLP